MCGLGLAFNPKTYTAPNLWGVAFAVGYGDVIQPSWLRFTNRLPTTEVCYSERPALHGKWLGSRRPINRNHMPNREAHNIGA